MDDKSEEWKRDMLMTERVAPFEVVEFTLNKAESMGTSSNHARGQA